MALAAVWYAVVPVATRLVAVSYAVCAAFRADPVWAAVAARVWSVVVAVASASRARRRKLDRNGRRCCAAVTALAAVAAAALAAASADRAAWSAVVAEVSVVAAAAWAARAWTSALLRVVTVVRRPGSRAANRTDSVSRSSLRRITCDQVAPAVAVAAAACVG